MSDADVLLSELHSRGMTITVLGSALRIVPKVTDAALVERLRAHKEELLDLLKDNGGSNDAVTARIVAMDIQRNEQDRVRRRGYDYDVTAPSHEEFLERVGYRTCRLPSVYDK